MSKDLKFSYARVFAPATVANVGCGFDVLGMAIDAPGDEVEIAVESNLVPTDGWVKIDQITGDDGKLPTSAAQNTASVALNHLLSHLNWSGQAFSLKIHKKMPLGSGLGSSAASAAGALAAFNALLKAPLTPAQLLPSAMEGERIACGSAHADNVAAALFGGFVLIRSNNPVDVVPIHTSEGLCCTVVHPDLELKTSDSRKVLRTDIPLATAVAQWANVGGLVAGLLTEDLGLIRRSLIDHIVEPRRAALIPGFADVKAAAMANDALGASISGAGPSIFALSDHLEKAHKIGQAMQKAFEKLDISAQSYVSKVNRQGPRLLDRR